jgi:hypothetical protein
MRAYTTTTTKTHRARLKAWLGVLALALAVGSLAAAASAGADGTPAGSMLTPGTPGGYSGAPLQKGDIGAPASDTTLASGSPAYPDDGFDWLSAAIGAAAAMALVALGGAAFLTIRRRIAVSPSTASTS